MILSCLPLPTTTKDLLHVQQHSATPRPHAPACGSAPVVAIDASNTTLHEWNVQLLRALLARARPTSKERAQMRERIGGEYAYKGSKVYSTLKYTLHQALDDPKFLRLISDKSRGLWLEFGVLTGLSTNITAQYAELARTAQGPQTVHGFDTFTGLRISPQGREPRYLCSLSHGLSADASGFGPSEPSFPLQRGVLSTLCL